MTSVKWRNQLALVLVAVACLFVLVVFLNWFHELRAQQEAVAALSEYALTPNSAEEIKAACSSNSGSDFVECAMERVLAIARWDQQSRDHQAQEWMAFWALCSVVVTFGGAIVSGIGIWLLLMTWLESKETNRIANRMGEAQVRAYVSMSKIDTLFHFSDDIDNYVEFRPCVKNTGQSPGVIAFASFDVKWVGASGGHIIFKFKREDFKYQASNIGAGEERTFSAGRKSLSEMWIMEQMRLFPVVGGVIGYKDVFSETIIHEDNFCALIRFDSSLAVVKPDNIPGHRWEGYIDSEVVVF